jgi:hypothetical protein
MPRGRPPNHQRRQQIARLHAKGLSLSEVGRRLGLTKQAVALVLESIARRPPMFPARWLKWFHPLNRTAAQPEADRRPYCLRCLMKVPDVPIPLLLGS